MLWPLIACRCVHQRVQENSLAELRGATRGLQTRLLGEKVVGTVPTWQTGENVEFVTPKVEAVFSLVILSGMTGQMLVKSAPSMPTMSQDRDQ